MAKIAALKRLQKGRFFEAWDEFIEARRVRACEGYLRRLIDDLVALGPRMTEADARRAVNACVRRFNRIDDGWICTIEREDIFEQIGRVIDLCGFEYEEDWIGGRDW